MRENIARQNEICAAFPNAFRHAYRVCAPQGIDVRSGYDFELWKESNTSNVRSMGGQRALPKSPTRERSSQGRGQLAHGHEGAVDKECRTRVPPPENRSLSPRSRTGLGRPFAQGVRSVWCGPQSPRALLPCPCQPTPDLGSVFVQLRRRQFIAGWRRREPNRMPCGRHSPLTLADRHNRV